jgi:transcriptional regulator GlxA family with amidase domain
VVRFRDDFLGHDFLQTPEMEPVRALLKRASRGLQALGKTRQAVATKMEKLAATDGLGRVIGLLAILDELARSKDLRPVSSPGFRPELSADDQGRMGRVFEHIHQHLTEDISRDSVAARASLSPGAFSRFFKTRTGKTLPQYVNELRVGRACSRLAEADDKVADIALDCGFQNLANFNRQFHRLMDASPREYRQRFRRSAMG